MAESKSLGVRPSTDEVPCPRLTSERPTKSRKVFIMYMVEDVRSVAVGEIRFGNYLCREKQSISA